MPTIHPLRALLLAAATLLAVLMPTAAQAAEAEVVAPTGIDFFDFTTPANVVLMIGFFVPVITAAITKKMASSQVKSVSTIVLTALTATASTLVGTDGDWAWRAFGNAFLSAFFLAILSYYGLWKHSGLNRAVTEKTADFGVLVQKRDVENSTRPDGPDPGDLAAAPVDSWEGRDVPDLHEASAREYRSDEE